MSKINSVLVPSGKFVTVTFITNDGNIRKINGRTGVKKYLKNGVKNINKSKYFLVYTRNGSALFDAPRMINKSSIREIKANGITVMTNKQSNYASTV
jgi:hypothetical protein